MKRCKELGDSGFTSLPRFCKDSDLSAVSPGPHILSFKSPCNTDPTGQAWQGSLKAWEFPAKIKTKEGNRMLMKTEAQARCGQSSRTQAQSMASRAAEPLLHLPRDQGRSSRASPVPPPPTRLTCHPCIFPLKKNKKKKLSSGIRPEHPGWENHKSKFIYKLFALCLFRVRVPDGRGAPSPPWQASPATLTGLCVNVRLQDCKSSLYQNQFKDSKQSIEEFCS